MDEQHFFFLCRRLLNESSFLQVLVAKRSWSDPEPSMASKGPAASTSAESSNPGGTSGNSGNGDNASQDSTFECNICLDTAKDAVISLCGHLFWSVASSCFRVAQLRSLFMCRGRVCFYASLLPLLQQRVEVVLLIDGGDYEPLLPAASLSRSRASAAVSLPSSPLLPV